MLAIRDLVAVHRALLGHLGIARPLAAIGGSLGGMQVLQWALDHPGELRAAVLVARPRAADRPEHRLPRDRPRGDHPRPRLPRRGLLRQPAAARRAACPAPAWRPHHLPVRAVDGGEVRAPAAGRRGPADAPSTSTSPSRATSPPGPSLPRPLRREHVPALTRVMDYFDPFGDARRRRAPARGAAPASCCCPSAATGASGRRTRARSPSGSRPPASTVTAHEVDSPYGHDSFLFALPEYHRLVSAFLTEVHAGGRCAPTPAT